MADSTPFESAVTVDSALITLAFGVVAFAVGAIYGVLRADGTALKRAGEAAALSVVGGTLARIVIAALLGIGDLDSTALLIGWLFFLIPGAVDTVILLFGGDQTLCTPDVLMGFALAVGCTVGLLNGTLRTYNWSDTKGVPQFVADVTWGLCGSMVACLLTLYNLFAGSRPAAIEGDAQRSGANRFPKGWHMPGHDDYAFTQGFTMSNLPDLPESALYQHERLHVLQNRVFGPIFTVSYLLWMLVWVIASLAVAPIRKSKLGKTIEALSYFSNPWETWAYLVQRRVNKQTAAQGARETLSDHLALSERLVAVFAVPWAAVVLLPVAITLF